jgi:hypothetical protein
VNDFEGITSIGDFMENISVRERNKLIKRRDDEKNISLIIS